VFKKLDGVTGDTSNVRASCALEYVAFVTGKVTDIGEAGEVFNALTAEFHAKCEKLGISIIRTTAGIRPMSQEEILSVVPRKHHFMGPDGAQVCSTPYVAAKYITTDLKEVDCKLCLNKMNGNRKGTGA
jgi:hypothetical protein